MSKKWYVVHAYSQYENHVRKALIDRIERAGLTDFFGGSAHIPKLKQLTQD